MISLKPRQTYGAANKLRPAPSLSTGPLQIQPVTRILRSFTNFHWQALSLRRKVGNAVETVRGLLRSQCPDEPRSAVGDPIHNVRRTPALGTRSNGLQAISLPEVCAVKFDSGGRWGT